MTRDDILVAVMALVGTTVFYLGLITYRHRSHINSLRKQGIPMPEGWSWLFGHSLVILKYTKRIPREANVLLAMKDLSTEFAETEMFLMDMWPGYPTSLIVFNPEALHLISNKWNLPRPLQSLEAIKPIVGGAKCCFSPSSINSHVPFIVDSVSTFCDKLYENVGTLISLDEFATRLTFDVIMKVTLDSDVGYQRSEHILPTAFDKITKWHSFWDIRVLLNPMRPFMQRRYGNIIKTYVRNEIEARFLDLKSGSTLGRNKAQSVISLALDAYISSKSDKQGVFPAALDESFVETVINQVRLFLFAGNDTTSSTIAFCFHSLAKYPACRAQMKKEHEALFGDRNAAQMLKDNPGLLNQCPYTNAFIKETLRLYPPAANMRRGQPGKNLTALNGQVVQTEGFNIICVQQAVHTNPRIWVRPQEFLPERWLVGPEHELHPPANGYRPFDVGSRTCIGLPLTMAEIKIVLLLAVRTFDIEPAYEEWDRLQPQSPWRNITKWFGAEEINTVYGDRAYQSEKAGTHPSSGYPCVVSLAGANHIESVDAVG